MNTCHPAISDSVAGLVCLSATAFNCTVLVRTATGASMMRAVVLGGTSFWKLEIDTERISLTVSEVTEFATRAKCWLSVSSRHSALSWWGFAKTDGAEGLWLIGGDGAKGVGGCGHGPLVRLRMGGRAVALSLALMMRVLWHLIYPED
jgi:hypothetical protein